MGAQVKTTIDIAEPLLEDAKKVAAQEGTTIRSLVEEGLRLALARRASPGKPFKLRKASFRGKGLHPDVAEADWDVIRAVAYEGRGG